MRQRTCCFALLAGVIINPARLGAQVFQLQGGGSSLFDGYGGMLSVWGNGYDANVGVGYLDGFRLTVSSRHLLGRDTLRLGNDILGFDAPTDAFGNGSAILVQGVGIQRQRGRTRVRAFGGASARALAAPFFSASRGDHAMAYLHAEHDHSRQLRLSGTALVTTRQSLFGSVQWTPRDGFVTAATVGLGSNAPYSALSIDSQSSRLDIKGELAFQGEGYRRADVPLPYQSEVERENIVATIRVSPELQVSIGRQHFRQDSAGSGTAPRATLNQVSGSWRHQGTALAAGVFDAVAGGVRNLSSYASASRTLTPWLQSDLYLLRVWEPSAARTTTPVLYLRETVSPRFNLLQVLTRDNGRTTVSFGGGLSSGLSSVSVDYQIVHTPYRTSNPFVHSLALSGRIQMGSYHFSVGTYVTPDGRVNYTASGSTFLYRGLLAPGASQLMGGRIDRYLVQGEVVDEAGGGVEGAAVEIGGETIYTDSRGQFFVRRSTARPLTVRVIPGDFLVSGTFEVVRQPSHVEPAREGQAHKVVIVVRRVPSR